MLLNIDLGELPGEDEELYEHAHLANVACGGHAGDDASMKRAVDLCLRHGTRVGAHPSYPDREGFGRRRMAMDTADLRASVREQCARLAGIARGLGAPALFVKAHGALYHAAREDAGVAEALVSGAREALGSGITVLGPATGELATATARAGLAFYREGFADRATRPDGTLVPRGEADALILDPSAAATQASRLVSSGEVDTVCVHGDTPGAVAIARAVRSVLDARAIELEPFGDTAWRARLPEGGDAASRRMLLEGLRALPHVVDVVVSERHALVVLARGAPLDDAREAIARAVATASSRTRPESTASPLREHHVLVRYDGADLAEVAAAAGLSPAEVVAAHAGTVYEVAAMGFLPGFAYLRALDPRLVLPRRPSPRPRVPALSVAIAGPYTGVYPLASPGGWHLLGTAVGFAPFDPRAGAVMALGDRVRFVARNAEGAA